MSMDFNSFTLADWERYIKRRIKTDCDAALSALGIVYGNQTEIERRASSSIDHNGCGFDRNDASILSEIAAKRVAGEALSDADVITVMHRMPKYWRQVMDHLKANVESLRRDGLGCKPSPVVILRHPTEADWQRCLALARHTVSKDPTGKPVSDSWKRKALRAQHSPIRTLMFTIEMELPYYSSVHFARHKIGVEHYVTTQRNDRQGNYDRRDAPQGQLVRHVMDINADALIGMAHRRLCTQADAETRYIMSVICRKVIKVNPEFSDVLVPMCEYQGRCPEFKPCGRKLQREDCQPVQMQLPI